MTLSPIRALDAIPARGADPTPRQVKDRARHAVRIAVKAGHLVKPAVCSRCGKDAGKRSDGVSLLQGHHYLGYSRPLAVRWLCQKCHRIETPHPVRENSSGYKNPMLGDRNGNSRIDEATARRLLSDLASGARVLDLVKVYPISETQIRDIKRGKQWRHLPRPDQGAQSNGR